MQIQAYLSAIVQNLKRLVALSYYWLQRLVIRCKIQQDSQLNPIFQNGDFFNRPQRLNLRDLLDGGWPHLLSVAQA